MDFSGMSTKIGHTTSKRRSPGMKLASRPNVKWMVGARWVFLRSAASSDTRARDLRTRAGLFGMVALQVSRVCGHFGSAAALDFTVWGRA